MSYIEQFAQSYLRALRGSRHVTQELLTDIADILEPPCIFEQYVGPIVAPAPGEIVGVAGEHKKTAALFFDRVWSPPGSLEKVPADIAVYGATKAEQWMLPYYVLSIHLHDRRIATYERNVVRLKEAIQNPATEPKLESDLGEEAALKLLDRTYQRHGLDIYLHGSDRFRRTIANCLRSERGMTAVPMYSSKISSEVEYAHGDTGVLVAAISDLALVDEEKLSWEQIREFRQDIDAKTKFRKLRNWLDTEAVGKTVNQLTDLIAVRLDGYEWAIKKHGIGTITGSMSELLDPRFLGTAAPIVGSLWAGAGSGAAELAAGILLTGRVAVSVTQKFVDLIDHRKGPGSEVAFVHELKKLSKK